MLNLLKGEPDAAQDRNSRQPGPAELSDETVLSAGGGFLRAVHLKWEEARHTFSYSWLCRPPKTEAQKAKRATRTCALMQLRVSEIGLRHGRVD